MKKKSLKIVSSEKNLALQAQSLLWRLDLLANEDSKFGSMFLEFEQMIEKCIAKFSRKHFRKKKLKKQEIITKTGKKVT